LVVWHVRTAGEIKDGILRIGNTSVAVYTPETKMKVPDVLFYENAQVELILLFYLVAVCCTTRVEVIGNRKARFRLDDATC